ncbi:MAG: type II pantothenate kinase [Oscillospiraceae bacterium]|nr:type II pantothenate kinase [Oscillospiraceae bacterium]
MKCVLGIDIGGSTTKIIGYRNGEIFSPLLVKASDPRASLYGAFGKFLSENKLSLSDISSVMITGVGADDSQKEIFGVETHRIEEFRAVGHGGLFLSGLDSAVVVSMGTGTAFVSASRDGVYHMGGTGIGGGTLIGLSNRMFNVRNFDDIIETAASGDLNNVDLHIRDISREDIETLAAATTASNFGRISDLATNADLALGIINMVFQTIGVMAAFSAKNAGTENIVLTGNLTNVPQAENIFKGVETLHGVKFIIPEHSEYATATGAALMYGNNI